MEANAEKGVVMNNQDLALAFLEEVFNRRNQDFIDQFIAEDFRLEGEPFQRIELKQAVAELFDIYPDLRLETEWVAARPDRVELAYRGLASPEKLFTVGRREDRQLVWQGELTLLIQDGLIIESRSFVETAANSVKENQDVGA